MQKKILRFTLLVMLLSSLYGCSCSKRPAEEGVFEPGLYIVGKVGFDGKSLKASFKEDEAPTVNVKLRGENSGAVTVTYQILASDSRTKPLAIIGDGDNSDVGATPANNTITFDGSSDTFTITLPVRNDDLYELDEVFFVELSAASGAEIIASRVEVIIENDDVPPTASIQMTDVAPSALVEAVSQQVEVKISLDFVSGVDALLKINNGVGSDGLGAVNRIDYILSEEGSILPDNADIVIKAGQQIALINLEVIDDADDENLETFSLDLQEVAHVLLSEESSSLAFSIVDNDTAADGMITKILLNDTGMRDVPDVVLPEALIAHIDKNLGRDSVVDIVKTGGGIASFDYSKISAAGEVMDDDAGFVTLGSGVNAPSWDCVRDNTTGFYWEVKVADNNHVRGSSRTYFWYDPNDNANGGEAGRKGELVCDAQGASESILACNTAYYVADMNKAKLCGMTGWRLPTVDELRSIADYSPSILVDSTGSERSIHYDADYFAGDVVGSSFVWTSTTVASDPLRAWVIRFGSLFGEEARLKASSAFNGIRLVNDSKIQNEQ